ncbi:toll-like receptor 13 [Megalops cyprinoides]|uniref:toll-like receptor 13 n=1 Tax=Megalops cyprinoides TaxID=118141 RepID=UPI0018654BDA|nr:toll-like receptor 13 [Megalops cyprinoides]
MLKNQMTELTTNAFAPLRKLTKLSVRYNFIQVIANKPFCNLTLLNILDLSMNIISHIEKGSFECLVNLKELNLGGNHISKVNPDTFLGLGHLKTLTLYNNYLHFQKGDSPFTGLRSLKMLNLCYQGPVRVGMGYLGPTLFNGLTNLQNLSLGYVSATTFDPDVFAPVAKLKLLYIANIEMTNNNLTALFRHLASLEDLYLMQCDLDVLPATLLPPQNSLKYLKIQSNHFHTLEKSLHDNLPMLEYLDVTGNPLSCSCENAWFKNWSVNSLVEVPYLYDLRCNNDPKAPHLWQFDDKACGYDVVCFNYFVSTAVVDVLFLLLGLTWHKHASSICYLILLLRSRVGGRKKGRKEDFTYDAFISYSSRDDPWVMGELVPRMEGPNGQGFRLCLHHRDFRLGAAILENIEAAIYSSRRTLCVVSRDFLRSEWCALEFQLASLRLLCDRSDVLLLVFLEKIPDHCLSPYTRLRRMVRKNTYLLWPENAPDQEAFWVRLQDALREGRVEEEENDEFARLLG